MSRIIIAVRAFLAALASAGSAAKIQAALDGPALPKVDGDAKSPQPPAPREAPAPTRSEALTLLAALQREARLVDLVQQPLGSFSDDQIGAAARTVLGDCGVVLNRFFALEAVLSQEEESLCNVPAGYDPGRYKLSGRVEGSGPFHGKLVHHGWRATTVKLPAWSGSKDSALVIAPAEVEV
jgi:hypothetical protein